MSDPLVPNYNNSVGRLVTDRFDFEAHVEGTKFQHKAANILLNPNLVINSVTITNTQDAIAALNALITPTLTDATTSSKGVIQLAGDIAGTADNILVTRIQGKPINTLTPDVGDILTWDGYAWGPVIFSNFFSANGDLSGNNVTQSVISLTGTAGVVQANCNNINFSISSLPSFSQTNTSGSGHNFFITAQSSTGAGLSGGSVNISGGSPGSGGLRKGFSLQMDNGNTTMLSANEIAANRRVLSLVPNGTVTSTNMPSSTGDRVIFVADAATSPSTGVPVGGTILYSDSGKLWIKQADSNNFAIGTISNPNIQDFSEQEIYTTNLFSISNDGYATTAFSFNLPDLSTTRIDAVFIGKQASTGNSASFNLSMAWIRNGGAPVAIGSITSTDPRNVGTASGWTAPTFSISSNTLNVLTGYSSTVLVGWFVVIKLYIANANV